MRRASGRRSRSSACWRSPSQRTEPSPAVTHAYDFLILGSGIAGLYAALLASHSSGGGGSVALITKGAVEESNTKYAQGGIAAAVGPGDTASQHLADTLEAL